MARGACAPHPGGKGADALFEDAFGIRPLATPHARGSEHSGAKRLHPQPPWAAFPPHF